MLYGQDVTYHANEVLEKLDGFKFMGTAIDDSDPNEPFFGLVFKKGKHQVIAWVQSDPEGNGSGFLNIE